MAEPNVMTIAETRARMTTADGSMPDERTIRRACELGQIPSIRVGRRIFVLREPFMRMLAGESV